MMTSLPATQARDTGSGSNATCRRLAGARPDPQGSHHNSQAEPKPQMQQESDITAHIAWPDTRSRMPAMCGVSGFDADFLASGGLSSLG